MLPSDVQHVHTICLPILFMDAVLKELPYGPKENYTRMLIVVACNHKDGKTASVCLFGKWLIAIYLQQDIMSEFKGVNEIHANVKMFLYLISPSQGNNSAFFPVMNFCDGFYIL